MLSRTPPDAADTSPVTTPCCSPTKEKNNTLLTHCRLVQFFRRVLRKAPWTLPLLGLATCTVILAHTATGGTWTTAYLLPEVERNLRFMAQAVWGLLPYFCLGVAVSAWVQTSGVSDRIKRVFEQREGMAIAVAAVAGATIPLCSCSVVPLIAALLVGGAPLGAIMALWISSPLMSPAVFLLTAGALGMPYAIARLVTAILMGAAAGYVTSLLAARHLLRDPVRSNAIAEVNCCSRPTSAHHIDAAVPNRARLFWSNLRRPALFLGKWLLVAFFLEALIVHYVDSAWITSILGAGKSYSIPIAMLVGIPLYVSDIAAVPVVQGLLDQGMAPGAALTFLIAGPVTTIPAMVAVWALVRGQTFAIYLSAGMIGSLTAGYLFQTFAG